MSVEYKSGRHIMDIENPRVRRDDIGEVVEFESMDDLARMWTSLAEQHGVEYSCEHFTLLDDEFTMRDVLEHEWLSYENRRGYGELYQMFAAPMDLLHERR